MRELHYKEPVKLRRSRIANGQRDDGNGKEYYSKFSVVYTVHGIVTVLDFDWKHNRDKAAFTEFHYIFKGMKYSAELKEQRLSDRQVLWLATHFARTVLENLKP